MPPSGWPEKSPTSEPYTDAEIDRMIIDGFTPCCADDLAPRLFATIRRIRAAEPPAPPGPDHPPTRMTNVTGGKP